MPNEHAGVDHRREENNARLSSGMFRATRIAGTHFGPGCGPAPESQRVFPANPSLQAGFVSRLNDMTRKARDTGTTTLDKDVMTNREAAIFAMAYAAGHTEATQAVLQLLEASRPEKKSQTADEKGR